jgi:hypothetical protein
METRERLPPKTHCKESEVASPTFLLTILKAMGTVIAAVTPKIGLTK